MLNLCPELSAPFDDILVALYIRFLTDTFLHSLIPLFFGSLVMTWLASGLNCSIQNEQAQYALTILNTLAKIAFLHQAS